MLGAAKVIGLIAMRNLWAHGVRTLFVGGVVGFGALLIVVGGSLLASVEDGIRRSISGSVVGDIQVYSAESEDQLAVLGGLDFEGQDLAVVEDFGKVRDVLAAVPNVKAVVPMGVSGALVNMGNEMDRALSELRGHYRRKSLQPEATELDENLAAARRRAQHLARLMNADVTALARIQGEGSISAEELADVKRAVSDEFWLELERSPSDSLEFLENRVAPQMPDSGQFLLQYVGTDPTAFVQAFPRLRLLEGELIPAGHAGFMFSKYVYERVIKLRAASRLDEIKQARDRRGARIAFDPALQDLVRQSGLEVDDITRQLDQSHAEVVRRHLQLELGSGEADLSRLLSTFFQLDDGNFERRRQFFYERVAPELRLYRVAVGDTLTIRTVNRRGYARSVDLHVYGVFAYEGFEEAPQAGILNLMDLESFRVLSGLRGKDTEREIDMMRDAMGVSALSREDVEAQLFTSKLALEGSAGPSERPRSPGPAPAETDWAAEQKAGDAPNTGRTYDPAELRGGPVLNAAVVLQDSSRLHDTLQAIDGAAKSAGLPLKAMPWQEAAGNLGQLVSMMSNVLLAAVAVLFLVALMIIGNALLIATLERVPDLGTLRAIGARRSFVLSMLSAEVLLMGLTFGCGGALLGVAIVALLNRVGIPAGTEALTFFFAGPRLYPTLSLASLATGLLTSLGAMIAASGYPAWLALRVSPRQAMGTEE